jgi:hypothetical protein
MKSLTMARPASPLEHEEQSALFERTTYAVAALPELAWLFAIPNGGYYLSPRAAGRLKAQGLKAGVPDTCLPVPRGRYAGLWIEMKRRDAVPSDTKPEQRKWHEALRSMGYRVEVCKGWEAAWAVLMDYLSGEEA